MANTLQKLKQAYPVELGNFHLLLSIPENFLGSPKNIIYCNDNSTGKKWGAVNIDSWKPTQNEFT